MDFLALNVRWDANAYGSVAWATVGFHGTIPLLQVVESLIFTWFMHHGEIEEKHFSDASDTAFYWYFLTGSWVPLYSSRLPEPIPPAMTVDTRTGCCPCT